MNNIIFSVFKNGDTKKRGWDITMPELYEKIQTSDKLKKDTIRLRDIHARQKTAEAKMKEFEEREDGDSEKIAAKKEFDKWKHEYSDTKKMLPLISVHAYFEERRRNEDPHTYYNLIFTDIDHISETEVRRLLSELQKRSYVAFACRSVSGEGLHFFIPIHIENETFNDENFKSIYATTAEYIDFDLNTEVDRGVNSISRCMFLNYDEEAYYNPEATPLDITNALWLNNNTINISNNNNTDMNKNLNNYLDAANLNFTPGNRHSSLVSLASCCNMAGFPLEDVITDCCKRYSQPDFDNQEIEETIRDVYSRYTSEHGSNQKKFTLQKDKKSNGQKATKNLKEQDEDFFDEEEMLSTPCPDVETIKKYIPDYFYQHVVDPQSNKEVQFASIMGLLTATGAMMRDVNCFVKKGEITHPYLFMCLIGEAASGKSCINRAAHLFYMHAEAIENESRNRAKQKLSEIKEWQKCIKNCDSDDCGCGEEPEKIETVKITLSMNASQNKLIKQLSVNGDIPSLLFSSETDFIMDPKEMPLSTSLRALYENEPMGSHTLSRGDDTVQNSKGALLTAGTPAQQIRYFKNKEDGLVSRHITLFLPETDYISLKGCIGIEKNCTREAFVEESETIRNRTLTFSTYVSTHEFWLLLTDKDRELLDEYFSCVDTRFAKYSSNALTSFLRRLRGINIRLALILSVNSLFMENKPSGKYDIQEEIIRLIISWNDYLVEQNIKLLNILPENQLGDGGTELKYAHVFDSLPCNFTFGEACTLFLEKAGACKRTAQRTLKRWVKKGLLTQHLQRYYKVNCQEESPSRA